MNERANEIQHNCRAKRQCITTPGCYTNNRSLSCAVLAWRWHILAFDPAAFGLVFFLEKGVRETEIVFFFYPFALKSQIFSPHTGLSTIRCHFLWQCDKVTVNADQQLHQAPADTRPTLHAYTLKKKIIHKQNRTCFWGAVPQQTNDVQIGGEGRSITT